jgi:hypothetical protein
MRGIVSICILLVLLSLGALGSTFAQSPQNNAKIGKPAPEHVIYEFYFRRISMSEDMAKKDGRDGLIGNQIRTVMRNELGINDAQRAILNEIGKEALAKAAVLDAKAMAIIQQVRSRYPGGELPSKDAAPQTPPELAELQLARNAIFANARTQLSHRFETIAFQNLDAKIKSIILPKIEVKTPETAK